jgi:regulatory protein
MAMPRRPTPRPALRSLDRAALGELALRYVGRFATSEARLRRYLLRKVKESAWTGDDDPAAAIADAAARCAALGYVNDGEFARLRGAALTRRGLGARRVRAQLGADGIGEADAAPVLAAAADERLATALAFARRRRLGPFAREALTDPRARDKAFAAMLRAGHDSAAARRVLSVAPGDAAALAELDAEAEAG